MAHEDNGGLEGRDAVERRGSAGEKQLARMLDHYRMRFFYEHPLAVLNRGKVRVWYCDFWLPDYSVALEYAGMTGNPDYDAGIAHKKAVYEASGVSCLFVYPDDLRGYWPKQLMKSIHQVLAERLAAFDSLQARSRRLRE